VKSPRLKGFTIGAGDVADLVAFLNSLTDPAFLSNAEFAAPAR
jgi:hypothetical protein